MTPIEKNVKVVDEKGNILEATYPKRAKGLVKNGRARFVDENTICLACPPNKILEDNKMDNINIDKTTGLVTETPASKYNLEYALEQIERIAIDTEHITKAFAALYASASNSETTYGQGGTHAKVAEAVAETVKCRETTNQKLIEFYSKMVDDLKPNAKPEKKIYQGVIDLIHTMYGKVLDTTVDFDDDEARNEAINNITSQMHDLIEQAIKGN